MIGFGQGERSDLGPLPESRLREIGWGQLVISRCVAGHENGKLSIGTVVTPLLENALLVRRKRRLFWLAWTSAVIVGTIAMSGSMYYYYFGRS